MGKAILFERQKGLCWLCDGMMTIEDATFDHLIPVAFGGKGGDNLRLAHKLCNNIRGCLEADKSREYVQGRLAGKVPRLPTDRSTKRPKDKRRLPGEPGYWLQKLKESRVEIPCTVIKWS